MTDLVAIAEANYLDSWKILAGIADAGSVEDRDHLVLTSVPVPVAYFNCAFVRPGTDPASCVDEATAYFAERAVPWSLRFRDEESRELHEILERAGLVAAESSPLMVAECAAIAGPDLAVDLRSVDVDAWDDHLATVAAGFDMPLELVTGLISPSLLDDERFAAINAHTDGDVASTAAVLCIDGVAGVYNVCTPERFRRRGLGEATTRAVVAEGERRGCALTTLQSSEMGYPIYERLGYQTVASWRTFTAGQGEGQ